MLAFKVPILPLNTLDVSVASGRKENLPSESSKPMKANLAPPLLYFILIPRSRLSSVPDSPISNIGSAIATVVELTVVVVPLTVKLPVTVRLSPTVTSDVVCPSVTGTPEEAAAILIPLVLSLVSTVIAPLASKSKVVAFKSIAPSTVSVPSMSVLSKFVTPSTSRLPDTSTVTTSSSPDRVIFLKPVISLFANKDITGFRNITLSGELDVVTVDVSGNLDVDGVTNLDNTDIDGTLTVDGAIDLNATTFDLDASGAITVDTSDSTNGIKIAAASSGVPVTLGHTTSEVTVGDNLTVTGNLTVSGTTTTVNSTTVAIADPIFEIGESGTDDNLDRGIKMKYNSGGAKFAFMGFDDSDGKFSFLPDATDTSNVFSGNIGTLKANIETGNTGLKVGASIPFSDSGGALTLQNVDAIDSTTETTLEAAIDSLTNLTQVGTITTGVWNGTVLTSTYGGTGLSSHGSTGQIMVSTGSGFQMQNIDGGTYS